MHVAQIAACAYFEIKEAQKRGKEFKIMGYEMPNVVKTIIIPFSEDDDGISFDDYKKKYGIDLEEVFNIQMGQDPNIKQKENTIYYVSFEGQVSPLVFLKRQSGYYEGFLLDPHSKGGDGGKLTGTMAALFNTNKTLSYNEF